MIKHILLATLIVSIYSVATADEIDEANKATRIAYCTTRATEFAKMYDLPANAPPELTEFFREKQVAAERLKQFVQLYLLRVGASNPNTLSVFAATKNGATDWQSCLSAVKATKCSFAQVASCQPEICKRLSDRCGDIDKLLPY